MKSNLTHSTIHFPNTDYSALTLKREKPLFNHLTLQNSPILFGCRTGICGTCLVSACGDLLPPNAEEQEVLEILAPDLPDARLACQIKATGDVSLTSLKL
ncbi:2Fe-2S iron-sulfur cluster-binding protein [cf. Phormidesmis sp. LEGE 11477]|uniref:2Fe-2S iron-sulfur cluster-binding protein n=1 Tax=cf. Phormidesmis sp. LEGE 11477 TaxID=1828680 RepID=UPI00188042B3|nr:2Fe-2S iron-sulfur cluster-binding protein [cf. Phormidesmis sp. LEGE 11477]MBE9063699.1 (2Fe-2S)-binding protein [cf. Phormidesmis sp. LEGE 11477]